MATLVVTTNKVSRIVWSPL